MAVRDAKILDATGSTSAGINNFDIQPGSGETWLVTGILVRREGGGAADDIEVLMYDGATEFDVDWDIMDTSGGQQIKIGIFADAPGDAGSTKDTNPLYNGLIIDNSQYIRIKITTAGVETYSYIVDAIQLK